MKSIIANAVAVAALSAYAQAELTAAQEESYSLDATSNMLSITTAESGHYYNKANKFLDLVDEAGKIGDNIPIIGKVVKFWKDGVAKQKIKEELDEVYSQYESLRVTMNDDF